MQTLKRDDLMSLEEYARARPEFRQRAFAHKRKRTVSVGPAVTLLFEDRLTIQYQIQEMLRVERIFEAEGIQDELDAYNPLVPDGHNLKATMLIEFPDVDERKQRLTGLIGIEDRVWVKLGEHEKIHAIADEDMERETEEKTSAVHFLRFEFTPEAAADARKGAAIRVGIDHANYTHETGPLAEELRAALAEDFKPAG